MQLECAFLYWKKCTLESSILLDEQNGRNRISVYMEKTVTSSSSSIHLQIALEKYNTGTKI